MKNAYPAVAAFLSLLSVTAIAQSSPQTPSREQEIQELRLELKRIADRLDVLEKQQAEALSVSNSAPATSVSPAAQTPAVAREQAPALKREDEATLSFFRGTTLNFGFDGYYGYNFNQPIGRVNESVARVRRQQQ